MKRMTAGILLLCLFVCGCIPFPAAASEWGVPVGGIHILKTNVMGEPLQGAVFQIVREPRDEELGNKNVEKKMMKFRGEYRIMTVESFWTDRSMTGERQTQVTTDDDGRAALYGLSYGTYYLVERSAPEGYNRIVEPIRIAIHKYSHLTEEDGIRDDEGAVIDNTLQIINVRYTLPDTGSWSTVRLAAAGTGVLFSAAALLLLNRRRWR